MKIDPMQESNNVLNSGEAKASKSNPRKIASRASQANGSPAPNKTSAPQNKLAPSPLSNES